jgi:Ca-activated chloride channel family protein
MKFQQVAWLLVLLPVVGGCWAFLRWSARRRRQSLDQVVAPRLHEQLLRSVDYRKRHWKQALLLAGLACVMAALARPLFGFREVKVERPGVDVMLCLDISRSMLAEDAVTNRLDAAKKGLQRLLELPSNDRFGLVAFAGEAFPVAPLTLDHGSILRTVAAMSTTSISKPGTDMAAAIKVALRAFEEKQEAGKAIILITDGEELQGDAVVAAREAVLKKISLFTVGVGTAAGARLIDRSKGPWQAQVAKNEFGHDVVSRLNERVLQQVAAAGHGFYLHLGAENEALLDISDRGLRALAKGSQMRQSKDMREYFQIPLALGLALLAWELLMRERKRA